MEDYIFQTCHNINDLLISGKENDARNLLIKLLDYHKENNIEYIPLINHLIREVGLYPYIDENTAHWEDRLITEIFKVDTGDTEEITLHREQSLLLKNLLENKSIAVSAPTSFGKSFVIDAFIKIKNPKNVVIIVPTIALTDETRRRLYKKFSKEYKIITTTNVELGEKNIFIFPQERAFNYVNRINEIDILIIDEFYKASEKLGDDRAPDLIKAIIQLGDIAKQKYFLAPNISVLNKNPFTDGMEFIKIDFNTVFLDKKECFEEIKSDEDKENKLLEILNNKVTKTLIYAGIYKEINKISDILLKNKLDLLSHNLLNSFSNWLKKNYSSDWFLVELIKKGVGIHNGSLHRSLTQIQVKLFEERKEGLQELISTSSIIEGVNTSAENVVIWKNKNGNKKLNDFTYKNIIGRGGRMFKHFIGKIYILDAPPKIEETLLEIPFPEGVATSLDYEKYNNILNKEQIDKIIQQEKEMDSIFPKGRYRILKNENVFQTTDYELLKKIALSIKNDEDWNGLGYLNSKDETQWARLLYKIIKLKPGNWGTGYSNFVEFIKAISHNWNKTIPEQLKTLEKYSIGIDKFFELERKVAFDLTSLLKDINTIQKEIIPQKNYDISQFINGCSNAFLPPVIYQLEEYGLPRMISIKLHKKAIDLIDTDIHKVINDFINIGYYTIIERKDLELDEFDEYILNYFYEGITPYEINIKTALPK